MESNVMLYIKTWLMKAQKVVLQRVWQALVKQVQPEQKLWHWGGQAKAIQEHGNGTSEKGTDFVLCCW